MLILMDELYFINKTDQYHLYNITV